MPRKPNKNILSPRDFTRRVFQYLALSFLLIFISLGIGIFGYHFLCDQGWIDSLYNASMILTGMGPVATLTEPIAKLFASFYALFSGIVFLSTVAIFFAPFAHRLMHIMHVDEDDMED
jgi:hypothetical protein